MATIDEVAAIRVFAVDRQPETAHQVQHSLGDQTWRSVVGLGRARIRFTGQWQDSDVHGDGSIHIQQRHYQEYPSEHYKPA